jgi:Uma2 family endonuclease
MAVTLAGPELALRSQDAAWNRARWETLPADGNRYEVIDGVLYMTTAPSVFHQWIVKRLAITLHQQIDEAGEGITFFAPIGVFMPGCDPVQPDVLVIRAGDTHVFQEGRIVGIPAPLIEVQSPSNPNYDSRIKLEAYARAGVPEYWIVRPATRDVLVNTRPDTTRGVYGEAHVAGPGGDLVSPTLPIRFPVATLFAGAPDTTLQRRPL